MTSGRIIPRLLIALTFLIGIPRLAGAQPQISAQAREIGIKWLLTNCGTQEGNRLRDALQRFKAELEPFFLHALQQGPDEKQMAELEQASEARYRQRQETLKNNRVPLKEEDRRTAEAVTREQFISQEKQDFVLRYKSQAAAGLGIVGGPQGRAALERLSRDKSSALQSSAAEALRSMTLRDAKSKKQ